MKKAIILANGLFPKREEALQAILQTPLLICCDGAYNRLVASRLFSHASVFPEIYVVGDGDSLSNDYKPHDPDRTVDTMRFKIEKPLPAVYIGRYAKDQDCNDLTKAVRHALSLDVTHIVILGATGLREDHTLGNISLLAEYVKMKNSEGNRLNIRMYTDYGYFTPIVATTRMQSFPGQQVSLFPLNNDISLSVEGLKYPINDCHFNMLWEATLNESLGKEFVVNITGDGVVLVYQTHISKT